MDQEAHWNGSVDGETATEVQQAVASDSKRRMSRFVTIRCSVANKFGKVHGDYQTRTFNDTFLFD